jgi:hypothetical protein
MSWSVSVTQVDAEKAPDKLREAFVNNVPSPEPEVERQFKDALMAVEDFIARLDDDNPLGGAGADHYVNVSLNGHVRLGDNQAGASVSISVQETMPPKAEEATT